MRALLKLRWPELAANSLPTFYNSDNEISRVPVFGRIDHRKKSLGHATLSCFNCAIRDELHQLLTIDSTAPAQFSQWICDQPEAGFALIRGRKILKSPGVKQNGSEAFHSGLPRPGQHGVAGALEQRNTES